MMIRASCGWYPVMGLQAYLAGLPLSTCEQMIQRLDRDFFPLNEEQTWQPLGAAGLGTGWRYFQASGFHGWLAERD